MSERELTHYDNTVNAGESCGKDGSGRPLSRQCQEVFVYEAQREGPGRLSCVSCNPTGARPIGPSGIPQGTDFEVATATYQSRVISEGDWVGSRVFFDSVDALVPQDTNNKEDVYVYEAGHAYLLSDGTSSSGASFVDASVSGDDAFFVTRAQLVPQDTDQLVDLYDARAPHAPGEAVGFPVTRSVPCESEDCRPAGPAAPAFALPSSVAFSGFGNVPLPAPKPAVKAKVKRPAKPKKSKKRVRHAKRARARMPGASRRGRK